ncbi:DUF4158 domain-containing protein [Clostridium formicaceticum]|uniref:DUF4158 domain-containing protein n=1 Tax=Clostridium formicaceticum TaxID=1497 RepID=A0AAC9RL46_9CLOT|nr:DUF4158 domain-containing protein [Clostridium formicaceticum]AOY77150.1 hypothetical protein BJL90_15620 [Clostridium formicaceticum]ARE87667.1 hypothetical protein CLFO_20670 [Clostridium formicaceticum]
MATPEILLTEEQRLEFTQISPNINEWEIAKYYTFSEQDKEIINRHRRDYNRLGFAVQLGLLRNPGWALNNVSHIPDLVLEYIAEQLNIDPKEMTQYAQRENTRLEHLQEIREEYGYRNFIEQDEESLFSILLSAAIENDNIINLMKTAIETLRKQKIILPGITTIEKFVHDARIKAEDTIIEMINSTITDYQKSLMNRLINAESEETITKLAWLRGDFGYPSPKAFLEVIERLEEIRKLNLNLNIDKLHPNRIRQLSRLGKKYEPHSFRRFDENKRYAILAIYMN